MSRLAALVVCLGLIGAAYGQSATPAPTPPTPTPAPTPTAPESPRSPMLRPQPGLATKPRPVATIFNPNQNVKEAIDAAIARGEAERRRVLVVWGDNQSRFSLRWQEVMQLPDTDRLARYHYEVIHADISEGGFGMINRELAKSYGAELVISTNMRPYLTVIETVGENKGKAVLNRSSEGLQKPRSSKIDGDYFSLLVQDFLAAHRLPGLVAGSEVEAALARAKTRGVPLLVFFLDLEDAWSTRFDLWLKKPGVVKPEAAGGEPGPLARRFEVLTVDVLRWQGGAQAYADFGGDAAEASPWYVIVDADRRRLAPDKDKGESDLGFPTGEEVPKFIAMLRRVQPALTEDEGQAIAKSLEGMVRTPSGK